MKRNSNNIYIYIYSRIFWFLMLRKLHFSPSIYIPLLISSKIKGKKIKSQRKISNFLSTCLPFASQTKEKEVTLLFSFFHPSLFQNICKRSFFFFSSIISFRFSSLDSKSPAKQSVIKYLKKLVTKHFL